MSNLKQATLDAFIIDAIDSLVSYDTTRIMLTTPLIREVENPDITYLTNEILKGTERVLFGMTTTTKSKTRNRYIIDIPNIVLKEYNIYFDTIPRRMTSPRCAPKVIVNGSGSRWTFTPVYDLEQLVVKYANLDSSFFEVNRADLKSE